MQCPGYSSHWSYRISPTQRSQSIDQGAFGPSGLLTRDGTARSIDGGMGAMTCQPTPCSSRRGADAVVAG